MGRKVLITGGLGFIGSNLARYWLEKHTHDHVIVLDSQTYAARPEWIREFALEQYPDRYSELRCDITAPADVHTIFDRIQPDDVIHLAAESHVCRSIEGPRKFADTNIMGTFNLLEAARILWSGSTKQRFHHVSTDEVFGEAIDDRFRETTRYNPRSPYAASKAASDHLVMSYHHTYGLNTTMTNCSNNFGPNQHEEKLIPKAILSVLTYRPMSVYGAGTQVRDWLFVDDHSRAIDTVFHRGYPGSQFCVGGEMELSNLDVISEVVYAMRRIGVKGDLEIKHTNDRPTDDRRYAVDCTALKALGWEPNKAAFKSYLEATCYWYVARHR